MCWVFCITFTFMSCHLVFAFLYLVYIWFSCFVIIILYIPMFCSNMSSYPVILLHSHGFFFLEDNHVSYIPMFCSNISSYIIYEFYLNSNFLIFTFLNMSSYISKGSFGTLNEDYDRNCNIYYWE